MQRSNSRIQRGVGWWGVGGATDVQSTFDIGQAQALCSRHTAPNIQLHNSTRVAAHEGTYAAAHGLPPPRE